MRTARAKGKGERKATAGLRGLRLVGTVSPEGEHLSPSCCVTQARARHLASLTRHTPLYLPLPHLRHPFFFFFLALLSLCLLLSISVAGFQVEAKKICTQRGQRLTSRCACRSDSSGCRQAVSQDSNPWGGTVTDSGEHRRIPK